jgi:hypothetical protein
MTSSMISLLLRQQRSSGHLLGLLETHDRKDRRSDIGQSTGLPRDLKSALVSRDDEWDGV